MRNIWMDIGGLNMVAIDGQKIVVHLLLEHETKLDAKNDDGITVLVMLEYEMMAQFLLEFGAKVNETERPDIRRYDICTRPRTNTSKQPIY